jgi:phycocyanobilin lyase subunit alpha
LGKNRIKESIPALLEALNDREDRTELGGYPLRRNAARALGKLGETASNIYLASDTAPITDSSTDSTSRLVISALIEALNCEDFYVREAASQSIEEIATSSLAGWQSAQIAIAPLVKLLEVGLGIEENSTLTNLSQPFEAILEALGRLKAEVAKSIVEQFLSHSVPRIRFAAARSMYGICEDASLKSKYAEILVTGLSNSDINLRRTVLTDLGEIGYLPAAQAISQCQAENSFKLFALKRILDHNLVVSLAEDSVLDSADRELKLKQVMEYMDELL